MNTWQWAEQAGWGQTGTVSGHVAGSRVSCVGMYVGTGCGASKGCPSGLCFLEVFWSPGPLALSAQPCLDLAVEKALFYSEDSCGDREAALAGGGEVISRLSPPMGADSLDGSRQSRTQPLAGAAPPSLEPAPAETWRCRFVADRPQRPAPTEGLCTGPVTQFLWLPGSPSLGRGVAQTWSWSLPLPWG